MEEEYEREKELFIKLKEKHEEISRLGNVSREMLISFSICFSSCFEIILKNLPLDNNFNQNNFLISYFATNKTDLLEFIDLFSDIELGQIFAELTTSDIIKKAHNIIQLSPKKLFFLETIIKKMVRK